MYRLIVPFQTNMDKTVDCLRDGFGSSLLPKKDADGKKRITQNVVLRKQYEIFAALSVAAIHFKRQ